jgi:hypothetical protein
MMMMMMMMMTTTPVLVVEHDHLGNKYSKWQVVSEEAYCSAAGEFSCSMLATIIRDV